MGNVESQYGSHSFYGDRERQLSRKRVSRSLRLSGKQSYRRKPEHRNSETSTRSSSTPSIPQSLAEHGLEPFDDADALPHFSSPIWVDRVAMNLRPMSFHKDSAHEPCNNTPANVPAVDADNDQSTQDTSKPPDGAGSFKKKRSKSADVWRDDSLEVSLSDASLERLTSTEDLTDNANNTDVTRANSLGELYAPQNYSKKRHKGGALCRDSEEDKMLSPCEDDGATYGAFTLPCRRSHCLSEGLTSHQAAMPGRRAQTIQDVTVGDVTELEDSGADGLIGDSDVCELPSRRYKALSVYSTPAGGSRDTPDAAVQGVYENFRQELEKSSCRAETLEEGASALSDELSSANQTEALVGVAEGSVRKAGRLNVKNLLVHKKNKKVELAARRKWKSYWVSLKGCTLFFYETDGRSGIDHTSIPKHAVWAENSIAQAVPEHPKKDFVFCLSNSMGDSFLFQTCSQTEVENWVTAIHSACAAAVARQHHRDDTVRFLRSEIRKLEQKIDMDEKMKKMGDMQLASVTDTKKRKTILEQISVWEQNLECYNVDLFRLRCYLCSLQGEELPNPKPLLSVASRSTKLSMGRLGFSVSSFHALVINHPPLNDLSVSASLTSLHPLNSPWASPSPLFILWWQLVQKAASGGEHTPCHTPLASGKVASPPCGGWRRTQRGNYTHTHTPALNRFLQKGRSQ
ncbi:rho guanine nucleotide exchange factor TIAM1 isoform X4 [Hemibagrus wyckioides]|uniref:rho guanine nucleotide exchange factor TIAM1 isoform X4 n=1 Tax=Hemibagrus wyckioides TaxID=337641 RepID=UPI00266D8CE5|nr:rho guanine nucleotide exchange factor TIAM1 isoform X4 [Hemibagrus wyckioides]